jgi:hypothetical protein
MKERELFQEIAERYPEARVENATKHYKVYIGTFWTTIKRHPSQEIPNYHRDKIFAQIEALRKKTV